MCDTSGSPVYRCPTVNVGLVTGPAIPRARQAPRMNVVFPEPSSPETVTTSPTSRRSARRAATRSVSSGEPDSTSTEERLEEAQLNGGLGRQQRRCLGLGDGKYPPQQLRKTPEVLLEHLQHRRRVQRRGRVVQRVEEHLAAADVRLLLMAVDACDARLLPGQELRGEVPERRHDGRLDQLDLPEQVSLAGFDLVGSGVAVTGRAALDHVRYVHVLARQPDPGEQGVEELPRLADEREALLVLVEAGRLPDE